MVYGPSPGPYSVTLKATAKVPDTIGAETLADFKQRVRAVMEKRTQYILGKLREASTRGPVFARTGTLARSWTAYPVRETEDGLTAGFFSRVPYAAIQETGGKITAKGKALTIPMGQNTEGV